MTQTPPPTEETVVAENTTSSRREEKDNHLRQEATRMMQRGMDKPKLIRKLIETQGIGKPRAEKIVEDVWEDGKTTRRTNAIILAVTGAVLIVIGLGLAYGSQNLPLSVVPLGFGSMLAWEAIQRLRKL